MMYKIFKNGKTEDQLQDIMHYIVEDACVDVACLYLDTMETAINSGSTKFRNHAETLHSEEIRVQSNNR